MATLKKILMVDDDADLREALADQLVATEEFDVFEAADGADGLARAREQHYDLVILDVGLPDMDGRELCRLMRKQGLRCPVLMLTGHATDSDQIHGLDAGANDVTDDGGVWRVTADASKTFDVRDALMAAGFSVESADAPMVSDNLVPVTTVEDAKKVLRIVDAIEDNDDVQDVFANFDIPDDVMDSAMEGAT